MLTTIVIPVGLQVVVPLALLWWHARVRPHTFTAWVLATVGVAGYVTTIAPVGNWDLAPWYTPFAFLLVLGTSAWRHAAWLRTLPRRPHSVDEWRETATYAGAAIAGVSFALVAVATRPIHTDAGLVDVVTLNLYRELLSSLIGLAMLVASIRSARAGRVLLSALFVWAAGTNLRVGIFNPLDYLNYAPFAVLDVYRAFILGFFSQHITAIVVTIAIGQAAIAFLLATNGRPRRLGYVGAIVFLLAIVPLGVGSGFPATILMALAAAEVLETDRFAVFGRNVTATDDERRRALAGDDLIVRPVGVVTHAVTIFKPPCDVWPWLVQMGAGRGGWYSYDALDNRGHQSATAIVPELQAVRVGMTFPALPGVEGTFELKRLDPEHALVLVAPGPRGPLTSWAFVLDEVESGVTRLLVRVRVARQPSAFRASITLSAMRLIHFIMERKQLNTLVTRVEGAAR